MNYNQDYMSAVQYEGRGVNSIRADNSACGGSTHGG